MVETPPFGHKFGWVSLAWKRDIKGFFQFAWKKKQVLGIEGVRRMESAWLWRFRWRRNLWDWEKVMLAALMGEL